jgi:hypothetical protein
MYEVARNRSSGQLLERGPWICLPLNRGEDLRPDAIHRSADLARDRFRVANRSSDEVRLRIGSSGSDQRCASDDRSDR